MSLAPSNDRPQSSLSDSWALLSNDSASEDDAQSEQTDLASVAGTNGIDDLSSLGDQDHETSSEVDDRNLTDDDTDSVESSPYTSSQHGISSLSTVRTATAYGIYTPTPEPIEFEEPDRWPDTEEVELKHTIRIFDEDEATELLAHIPGEVPTNQLVATIRQTMSKESLHLDQPFRVLYVGNPEAKHTIMHKIGVALIAGADFDYENQSDAPTRFNVVPTPYASADSLNSANLVPTDEVQLSVDECLSASSVKLIERQSDIITLSFTNRPNCISRLVSTEAGYQIESAAPWARPNVAIMFLSEKDDLRARRTRRFIQAFATRHRIPLILVSEEPMWAQPFDSVSLNNRALHLCLEYRGSADRDGSIVKRVPIDLNTFESISAGQMNRNLACLTGLYPGKLDYSLIPGFPSRPHSNPLSFVDEKSPMNTFRFGDRLESLRRSSPFDLRAVAAIMIILFLTMFSAFSGPILGRQTSKMTPEIVDLSNFTSVLPKSTAVTTTSSNKDVTLSAGSAVPNSIVAVDPKVDLAQLLLKPGFDSTNNSDLFEVHVLGDCHIILKPPRHLVTKKKDPKFSVEVRRNKAIIKQQVSKLFDGVYTVQLDREDAYGPVNVTIRTLTKPFPTQTSEVDFGNPWLKIASWKNAAQLASRLFQKDLSTAQVRLGVAYEQLRADLQVLATDTSKRAAILRREAEIMSEMTRKAASEKAFVFQKRSHKMSVLAAEQGISALNTLSKHLKTASKTFAKNSQAFSKELAVYADEAWKMTQEQAGKLREAAGNVDIRGKVEEVVKSDKLAKAQENLVRMLNQNPSDGKKKKEEEVDVKKDAKKEEMAGKKCKGSSTKCKSKDSNKKRKGFKKGKNRKGSIKNKHARSPKPQ